MPEKETVFISVPIQRAIARFHELVTKDFDRTISSSELDELTHLSRIVKQHDEMESLEKGRSRYHELVDKEFAEGLSPVEQSEFVSLNLLLDEHEMGQPLPQDAYYTQVNRRLDEIMERTEALLVSAKEMLDVMANVLDTARTRAMDSGRLDGGHSHPTVYAGMGSRGTGLDDCAMAPPRERLLTDEERTLLLDEIEQASHRARDLWIAQVRKSLEETSGKDA